MTQKELRTRAEILGLELRAETRFGTGWFAFFRGTEMVSGRGYSGLQRAWAFLIGYEEGRQAPR